MKILVTLRALFIAFATMNIALISHFARQAGISPSVCISLTILTSFTSAVMFRLLYGEILTKKHWAGMCAIMLSVILIGLNKAQKQQIGSENTQIVETDTFLAKLIPISLAFLSVLVYTTSGLLSRQGMNLGYRKIKFGVDMTGIAGIIYLVAFIYNELFLPLKFTLHVVILMSIAGLFCFSAFVFGNYALQSGPGAIVNAVVQSQSVLQMTLEMLMEARIPTLFEVLSMAACMAGAVIIATAKKN